MKGKLIIGMVLVLVSLVAVVGCTTGVSQEDYDAVVAERDEAQQERDAAQAQVDQLEDERDAAQAQVDQLEDERDAAQAQVDDLQAQLDQCQAAGDQAQVAQLQAQVDDLQAQLQACQAEPGAAQAQIAQLQAQIGLVQGDVAKAAAYAGLVASMAEWPETEGEMAGFLNALQIEAVALGDPGLMNIFTPLLQGMTNTAVPLIGEGVTGEALRSAVIAENVDQYNALIDYIAVVITALHMAE